MQRPEAALARLVGRTRHFNETVVEAQRMANRVLPALLVLFVVREERHDVLVDVGQRDHLAFRTVDRHRDQADVRIWRFGVRQ